MRPKKWFEYEIEVCDGIWHGREVTRIRINVNAKELYEYMDFNKTYGSGYIAFQQHAPGSKVHIRRAKVMPLND